MNDIAVMTQVMAAGSTAGSAGLRSQFGGQQAPAGDVFAMIFQQMTEGMSTDMQALFQQMRQMQEDQNKEGAERGMQMMAEMLLGMPPELQAILLAGQQENFSGIAAADLRQMAQQSILQDAAQNGETPDAAQDPTAVFQKIMGQLESQAKSDSSGEGLLQGEMNFRNAIQAAREKLGDQPKTSRQEIDIDSLQADVNAGRFAGTTEAVQVSKLPEPETSDLVSQLKTGILENMAKGKNEFVVKLKPDGMGEITVRLMEKDDKISMSILTTNAQVAKLLSNDVTALQNALRPLHAEVTQIVNQPQHSSAQQDSLAGQSFANFEQQQQAFQQNQPQTFYSNGSEPEEFANTLVQAAANNDAALDTYI